MDDHLTDAQGHAQVRAAKRHRPAGKASNTRPQLHQRSWIVVKGLRQTCILGIGDAERRLPQTVVADLTLEVDVTAAAALDDVGLAVDYKPLKERLLRHIARSRYRLLEALACSLADLVLEDERVHAVDVTVEKPGALTGATSVGVRIARDRVR